MTTRLGSGAARDQSEQATREIVIGGTPGVNDVMSRVGLHRTIALTPACDRP
jgi:hypothetical protein